jgi:hypothetical protein
MQAPRSKGNPRTEADARREGRNTRSALAGFFRTRWSGEVPLGRALWWDMACIGTFVNLAAGLAGMLLLTTDLPAALGALVYFSPLPYNLLLVVSVWRGAATVPGPEAVAAQFLSAAWFVLATLL